MELAASPTSIDRTQSTRTVPMRCLVLGAGRTGTKSICKALTILGLDHVYHMDSALNNPPDNDLWLRALARKYPDERHQASAFDREHWDQLLGHCQAVTDFLAVIFAKELIETYPEAKVVLTNRNVDSWYE